MDDEDEDDDENAFCSVVTAKTKPTFFSERNEGFLVRESFWVGPI